MVSLETLKHILYTICTGGNRNLPPQIYCGGLKMEIWKDIKGYEGLYQVSNSGRIKSTHSKTPKILISQKDRIGYLRINLTKNKKCKNFIIHRLVAKAFISNLSNYPQVNHKDGNKENNNDYNLEWCTHSQNIKHSYQNNLQTPKYGDNCNLSILKNEQVKEIKNLLSNYKRGMIQKIAQQYGVSKSTIKAIKTGQNWQWI